MTILTLGHFDHGKTTLSAAITKVLSKKGMARYVDFDSIDNAPEVEIDYAAEVEGKNSLFTCSISRINFQALNWKYNLYDCPGHRDYVKVLSTGFVQPDGAIIIVDATEGPMPQTREQILLARQANVPSMVVFLNKCDMVDDEEMLLLVEMEICELLDQYEFDSENTPIIRGSALGALNGVGVWEQSVLDLIKASDECFYEVHDNTDASQTYMGTGFDASIYFLKKEEGGRHTPITAGYRPIIQLPFEEPICQLYMPDGVTMLMPGDNTAVYFGLPHQVLMRSGQRFLIKEYKRVVGLGFVTAIYDKIASLLL